MRSECYGRIVFIGSLGNSCESRFGKYKRFMPTLRIELRFKGSFSHEHQLRNIESFLGHNEIS